MSTNNQPDASDQEETADDPQLTELVAYLDGELDEEQSSRLEKQFVTDAPLRRYAESLDRTWQLLDALGDASASGEFRQRTLESLSTVSAEQGGETTGRTKWSGVVRQFPFARALVWTLAGFAAGMMGLMLARSRPQKTDTDDIHILEELTLLREYEQVYSVPSAEFLKNVADAVAVSQPQESER